jgi:hypothetical protein
MSVYRFTQDAFVNNQIYLAGTTASTSDVGGSLPANWIPGSCVDPIDTPAILAVWNAGPRQTPLARQQWSTIGVAPAAIYWAPFGAPGLFQYQLTGAGALLGPRCAGAPMGNLP